MIETNNNSNNNLLGYKDELSSSSAFISYKLNIDIKEESFKYLNGNQFKNKVIFPIVCGNLDNILKIFPNQDLTIKNLELKSQLILKFENQQTITTNLNQISKNEYTTTFHYKDSINGNNWIESCIGKISTTKHIDNVLITSTDSDIQHFKDKCNLITLKNEELYESINEKSKFSYSGSFKNIEEVSYGKSCCLIKIPLNPVSSYDNESFLNVGIINACFQPLCVLNEIPSTIILEKIEQLKVYSKYLPKSSSDRDIHKFVYCYTEILKSNSANIKIMLPDGKLIIESPLVTFSSKDSNNEPIVSPNDQLFSTYLQSIDSPFENVISNSMIELFNLIPIRELEFKKALITCLYSTIKKKFQSITPDQIKSESIEFLISSYLKINNNETIDKDGYKFNLGKSMFEIFKQNIELIVYGEYTKLLKLLTVGQQEHLKTLTKISKLLLNETDPFINVPNSNSPILKQNQIISDLVLNSVIPLFSNNSKNIIRILELGSSDIGTLTELVLKKIKELDNQSEIDIEYTFSDNSNINLVMDKLSIFKSTKISILFKYIDLNKSVIDNIELNPSYYDIIILSTLSNIINLNQSIKTIIELLNPNGYLLIIDSLYKAVINNEIKDPYQYYQQWLSYNYIETTKSIEDWKQILIIENKLLNFISTKSESFVIQVQKPKFDEIAISKDLSLKSVFGEFDQIIIFGEKIQVLENEEMSSSIMDINPEGTDLYRIETIEDFEKHVSTTPLTNKSIIMLFNTNNISIENFKEITLNYCKINQHLLKNQLAGCKHVIVSKNVYVESSNPLAASITGAFRYFISEFSNQLNLYSLDFGSDIYSKTINIIPQFLDLTDSTKYIHREYIIRDKIYYERITQEINLKGKYKSSSFINEKDGLMIGLDENLKEIILKSRVLNIESEYIEIKVMATGIGLKDYQFQKGLITPQLSESINSCSGIITRIGNGVVKFKVGDHVFGSTNNGISSYVVNHQNEFIIKPTKLSFVEAASVADAFCQSYISLFTFGNLDIENKESVLIHLATDEIGIAGIELLKSKGFNGNLFVTVNSNEKQQFLIDRYGDFITGIYFSKNNDFVDSIKKKTLDSGVDLIINTLSNEFIDSNLNILRQNGGRIIDLSNLTGSQLNSNNEMIEYSKLKNYIKYSSVSSSLKQQVLKVISDMLESGKLNLIPFIEIPINIVGEIIQYLGTGLNIMSKVVVNQEGSDTLIDEIINNPNSQFNKNYIITNPNYKIKLNLGKTVLLTKQNGLSLIIIKWILNYTDYTLNQEERVNTIIILSKSSIKYELQMVMELNKLNGSKINIIFKQTDISKQDELIKSIEGLPIIESIFHNAYTPSVSSVSEIDINHLNQSHAKTLGLINLHILSISGDIMNIKNFIISSSFSTISDKNNQQLQCGYISSKNFIDSFSRFRKLSGCPCTSINWGVSKLFNPILSAQVPDNIIIGTLDLLLNQDNSNNSNSNNKIIYNFDFQSLSNSTNNYSLTNKMDYFLNQVGSNNLTLDQVSIKQSLTSKLSNMLSIKPVDLNLDIKLVNLFAENDNQSFIALKNWLDNNYVSNTFSIPQLESISINQLIQNIL